MKVYELISELSAYPAGYDVKFDVNLLDGKDLMFDVDCIEQLDDCVVLSESDGDEYDDFEFKNYKQCKY